MFGLLGKKLSHSFSKTIHESLQNEHKYNLYELDSIDSFLKERQFKAINVTIPYKEDVIPYLDNVEGVAKVLGNVNTIVNTNGTLTGYNTDYDGLKFTLSHNGISLKGKVVIILGNGSTSRTIQHLCKANLAKKIYVLARNPKHGEYHLDAFETLNTAQIIFNATPVGMFPNNTDSFDFDLNSESSLEAVVDLVYNPLHSKLLLQARKLNLKAVNGLMMLVHQAVLASEYFHNTKYPASKTIDIYKTLLLQELNIVFIGMPMSGKTHYAKLISKLYKKEVIDLDKALVLAEGIQIDTIFKNYGENHFRLLESKIVDKYAKQHNKAISTGGGVILNPDNIELLKQNGIIIFLDVPFEILKSFNPKNRPLLQNKDNLKKLFDYRHNLYVDSCDIRIIKKSLNEDLIIKRIEAEIDEYINIKWT